MSHDVVTLLLLSGFFCYFFLSSSVCKASIGTRKKTKLTCTFSSKYISWVNCLQLPKKRTLTHVQSIEADTLQGISKTPLTSGDLQQRFPISLAVTFAPLSMIMTAHPSFFIASNYGEYIIKVSNFKVATKQFIFLGLPKRFKIMNTSYSCHLLKKFIERHSS